jgi:hypothetical protein
MYTFNLKSSAKTYSISITLFFYFIRLSI